MAASFHTLSSSLRNNHWCYDMLTAFLVVYFKMLSVSRLCSIKWYIGQWMMNLETTENETVLAYLWYCSGISQEGPRKITNTSFRIVGVATNIQTEHKSRALSHVSVTVLLNKHKYKGNNTKTSICDRLLCILTLFRKQFLHIMTYSSSLEKYLIY
jgi:hypothetical protein